MESIAPLWAIVASGLVLLSIIVLIILIVQMHSRLSKFVKGKDGSSLEATLEWLTQKVSNIDDTLATHKQGLEYIDRRVKRSIRSRYLGVKKDYKIRCQPVPKNEEISGLV